MKKIIAVAALLAAGSAQAGVTNYYTTFEPEGGGGRTGSGTATASFDDVSHVFTYFATFSGLSGTTTVAHFHCCTDTPFTGAKGVAVGTPITAGLTAGTFGSTLDLDDAGVVNAAFITASGGLDAAITRFKAGLDGGSVYLNIHTRPTFTGGEIRGFMRVPEPASSALALLALGALGAIGRKSRRA